MHALCCSPIAQFFCQYLYSLYYSTSKKSLWLAAAKVSELGAGADFHQAWLGNTAVPLAGQDRPLWALARHVTIWEQDTFRIQRTLHLHVL